MGYSLLRGQLVHLTACDTQEIAPLMERWGRDSEYVRLLDDEPCQLLSSRQWQKWLEDITSGKEFFVIRVNENDQIIGTIGLYQRKWNHGDTFVGIGVGEREYWGRGYGTEAMRLVLQFAFQELNLHRVSLGVFAYNERAIRSYEKAGFRIEGRLRQGIHRVNQRWDEVVMGILRSEWETAQKDPPEKLEIF